MTFLDMLYTILLGPLELVFEVIYTFANRFIGHPGLAIIVLSLIMNLLVLPLYKRSDAMQEAARDVEDKLRDGVNHIKKTFSGDERMMILQTYYRQNNYKPTDALNGSVSLLLEIPFFMAAYNFLSNLQSIHGVSLGPIADLGVPDAMIVIGGITINFLPILMTLVNIVSSAIFLKGFPLKTKIQLYGMAVFFLFFLYQSPAGLVFYWTLNNVFSLVKTIVYKLKIGDFVKSKIKPKKKEEVHTEPNKKIFVLGGLFLTVLVGGLIPSTLIAASPQEFVDITYFYNPIWYIVHALCLASGTFLVWLGVFYWLASTTGKVVFEKVVWILSGIMLINYMFFGTDLGIISPNLQYENGLNFEGNQILLNLLVWVLISGIMYLIIGKYRNKLSGILLTGIITLVAMSSFHMTGIQASVSEAEGQADVLDQEMPHFTLSKEGKNVIVLMLDRAMGQYIPYFINGKTELKKQFSGFTYYSNVISYGGYTNFGAPALFGGYEYTPFQLNKRDTETLASKHNEALKVMPVLFYENGYDVTVCDPVYANYQWISDTSIYDDYPEIETYITEGTFGDNTLKEYKIQSNQRNFFCFSIMKTLPLFMQEVIYADGNYNQSESISKEVIYSNQVVESNMIANGMSEVFMKPYNVLLNLSNMTQIDEGDVNTFMMLVNNTTHEPMILQEPEYEPRQQVDNTDFADNTERYTIDGINLKMDDDYQISHYQTNMAAMLRLGKWFDYMRENDVYDNTRIIIVSDHGRQVEQIDELIYESGEVHDLAHYFPLLLVKDFESQEFNISEEFMTNADVPTLAVSNILENPINPFTGNVISNEEKNLQNHYIIISEEWDVNINNGNTFLPAQWYRVKPSNNIWDFNNWEFIDEKTVLPE